MKILGTFTSLLILSFIALGALTLVMAACGSSSKPQPYVCQHPAINNGMPMVMPEGTYTNARGVVVATNNGVTLYLNGAVCAQAVVKN